MDEQTLIRIYGTWGDCRMFPKEDWRYEVFNDDTVLGYWAWVMSKLVQIEYE